MTELIALIQIMKPCVSSTNLFSSSNFKLHLPTDQCKHFDDWFSNLQISLEECFDSSETKEMAEKKIHQLMVRHKTANCVV